MCCTARGLVLGSLWKVLLKVEAPKSFLFTGKLPCTEKKEHLVDFVITFNLLSLCFNAPHSNKVSQSTLAPDGPALLSVLFHEDTTCHGFQP